MIRLKKRTRKYLAPSAKVTQMALESNFCNTLRFNLEVKELENRNIPDEDGSALEPFYFES